MTLGMRRYHQPEKKQRKKLVKTRQFEIFLFEDFNIQFSKPIDKYSLQVTLAKYWNSLFKMSKEHEQKS